ncbi:S41 family peptidase [Flavobacterium subsaxonicum]|uniref:Tail specific protease domain-containing protein n=1 Tax=Flavobacterium subsaxonicum WB 4.1-42 = DSM 21790 TaxID=1121898 RepID=A0A0A2MIN4_9FLAO|nr:S41 family peptidase [Flavobacterium subsaxonicum]KGO92502.1 hypothetical protein Q766_12010 [Flavobacterium subsaxonicum WB 4.1-42 = DSM 21790]
MKKFVLLIAFLSCPILFAQNKVTESKKIQDLINIWGLLKYRHPQVSKGTFDFNDEFITELKKLQTINNQPEVNTELISWVQKFDLGKSKFKPNTKFLKTKNLCAKNANYTWIETSRFSSNLITLLNQIKNNGAYGDYYASISNVSGFVDFKNEKAFKGFDAENAAHRILFLSSFWNIIKYWDVNIYLADQNWDDVLTEMVPEFLEGDALKFEASKEKLFTKLNDSHADYEFSHTINNILIKYPAFNGRIVNDSLVITHLRNKELAKLDGIELGDVIVAVNGKDFKSFYIDKFSNLISASNRNYLRRGSERFSLLADSLDSIKVTVRKKDGLLYDQYIKLNTYTQYPYELIASLNPPKAKKFYSLNNQVGYINLAKITKAELKDAFNQFESTKGIVIDLRNYPGNISHEVANYLYPDKKVYVKILNPIAPGYSMYNYKSSLHKILNPFNAGHKNKNYYKGKIVLLVDRVTGSHAESIAMEIQQAPNCVTIGEQTFGAVMNRKRVPLMDNTTVDYTHAGAFYPDGTQVQRNGIKLDVEIIESAENYDSDLYIKEALKIIEQG